MKKKRSILIIKTDAIGDFFLSTGALWSLRRIFRDDKVTLAVHPRVEPFAKGYDVADKILPIDSCRYESDPDYMSRIAVRLDAGFDVVINAVYSRTWQSDNYAARTHAPRRIGFDCNDLDSGQERRHLEGVLYTDLVPATQEWIPEWERYGSLIELFAPPLPPSSLLPIVSIAKRDRDVVTLLLDTQIGRAAQYILVCPGAGFSAKLWSPVGFAEVINQLSLRYGLPIIVAGSSDDSPLINTIGQRVVYPWYNWSGKVNLSQFADLAGRASLFVGVDSTGFHFSWVQGVPTVGIFGGGHFGRFNPPESESVRVVHTPMDCYHCCWECKFDSIRCIDAITADMVLTAVSEVYKSSITGKSL